MAPWRRAIEHETQHGDSAYSMAMKRAVLSGLVPALILALCMCATCGAKVPASATGWAAAKAKQIPVCELPGLFDKPYCQPPSTLAWEDGVYVSRDGLTLYTDYVQCDLLSFFYAGADIAKVWMYKRGPSLGQNFSNPLGASYPWIHGDVAMSTRSSLKESFGPWRLSRLSGQFYNLGGFCAIDSPGRTGHYDFIAYTSDVKDGVKIRLMRDVGRDLAGDDRGAYLPANVDDPRYHEDNPHIERPDPTRPDHLVLFFDSDNMPGLGMHDVFYSETADGGKTWSGPFPVTSVNTPDDEEQPHLFRERGQWWLYLTAANQADRKLGIFRYRQTRPGDWNSWVDRELVVGAGTSASVGEPTLTKYGDLSFVAVTENKIGPTATDRYDCDPWFMARRR